MSKTIDEKVVEMRFDNGNFEKNVSKSLHTLDSLKFKLKTLDFRGTSDNITNLAKNIKNVDMSPLTREIETVQAKFSALQVIGVTALANLTNSAINAGKNMVYTMTNSIIQGGRNRAQKIKDAKFQMEGLLGTEEYKKQWDRIDESINYAVKDTAYGYDSAARAASQFLASNVKVGEEIIYTAPMDIYKDSPITKLYNAVDEDAGVPIADKDKLDKMICDIKNTITIAPFKTSRIPLIQQGAAIVSYDFEQNSFYSQYTLGDVAYSYKSNITEVIKYVEENLLSNMTDKKGSATQAINEIRTIASSVTGKMSNVWGRLTLLYMNYYCDYDMRIQSEEERPNEMLVNISKLLFGEKNGNPNKDLWFRIGYIGHMGDSSFDWVEQREED